MKIKNVVVFVFLVLIHFSFNTAQTVKLKENWSYSNDIISMSGYCVYENFIYLIDKSDNKVVVLKNGKLESFFGKEGNGPGEFISPRHILKRNNKIYIYDVSNDKLSIFNDKLKFVKTKLVSRLIDQIKMLSNGHSVVSHIYKTERVNNNKFIYVAIDLLDENFNKIKTITKYKYVQAYVMCNGKWVYNLFPNKKSILVLNESIYLVDSKEYEVSEYLMNSNTLRKIYHQKNKIKFDRSFYKEAFEYYKTKNVSIDELRLPNYNPFFEYTFNGKNKIYIVNKIYEYLKVKEFNLNGELKKEYEIKLPDLLDSDEILYLDNEKLIYSGYNAEGVFLLKEYLFDI